MHSPGLGRWPAATPDHSPANLALTLRRRRHGPSSLRLTIKVPSLPLKVRARGHAWLLFPPHPHAREPAAGSEHESPTWTAGSVLRAGVRPALPPGREPFSAATASPEPRFAPHGGGGGGGKRCQEVSRSKKASRTSRTSSDGGKIPVGSPSQAPRRQGSASGRSAHAQGPGRGQPPSSPCPRQGCGCRRPVPTVLVTFPAW